MRRIVSLLAFSVAFVAWLVRWEGRWGRIPSLLLPFAWLHICQCTVLVLLQWVKATATSSESGEVSPLGVRLIGAKQAGSAYPPACFFT